MKQPSGAFLIYVVPCGKAWPWSSSHIRMDFCVVYIEKERIFSFYSLSKIKVRDLTVVLLLTLKPEISPKMY